MLEGFSLSDEDYFGEKFMNIFLIILFQAMKYFRSTVFPFRVWPTERPLASSRRSRKVQSSSQSEEEQLRPQQTASRWSQPRVTRSRQRTKSKSKSVTSSSDKKKDFMTSSSDKKKILWRHLVTKRISILRVNRS